MTPREAAIKSIENLPDDASWQEIEERIRFIAAVQAGLEAARDGRVKTTEEVRAALEQWLPQ